MVVERPVEFVRGVELVLHRVGLSDHVRHAPEPRHEAQDVTLRPLGLAERQVVHPVGQVGHGRVDLVVERLGLHVQVPGDPVHHEVAGHLTPRVVILLPLLRRPVVLVVILALAGPLLGVQEQCVHGPIAAVIRHGRLPVLHPSQRREGHDALVLAQLLVRHAVDLPHAHSDVFPLGPFRKLFPRRGEALAPDAPGGVEVDDGQGVGGVEVLHVLRGQVRGMELAGVRIGDVLQCLLVLLVFHGTLFRVASVEFLFFALVVEPPLGNVFGDILEVGSESVPHIDRDEVAVDVVQRHVEIQPQ
mmetsp:Transcript_11718/g.25341  ORF Transcript_11718/g.25341 Transcript_11718/m.25341 type:complete len:302 (+) Transcript_11718:310-1215(+)